MSCSNLLKQSTTVLTKGGKHKKEVKKKKEKKPLSLALLYVRLANWNSRRDHIRLLELLKPLEADGSKLPALFWVMDWPSKTELLKEYIEEEAEAEKKRRRISN
jgi:hypothetical protein